MRRTEATDLSTIELTSIKLPARGEFTLRDAIVPELGLRLRSSGARTWVVFGREAGRTVRRTLGDPAAIPLSAARRLAATDTAAPCPAPIAPLHHPDARVGDVLSIFLKAGTGTRWKASTVRSMQAAADTHILPALATRRMRDVTREEVARWHLDVTARSTAARTALSTLSGLMLYGEDHGLRSVGTNPCHGLRRKERGHRGGLVPAASVKRLWSTLEQLHDRMPDGCDVVRLLLLTGARRSEILALEWDWIVGNRAVLPDSKTGSRTIWLNTGARTTLERRKVNATCRFVFPASRSDGPIRSIDRQWSSIRKEARLGTLRLHDLRHQFASVAVSNGIDLRIVAQLLGHHDLDSTLGYAHLATDALATAAGRVSAHIDRALQAKGNSPHVRDGRKVARPVQPEVHGGACHG